jgi:UPF0755 protein
MRLKKRYILRAILILFSIVIGAACVFVAEQYYRWHICNLRSKDGKTHGYHVYANTSVDSVLNLVREDYNISSETDLRLHIHYFVLTHPEPGYYLFPDQVGDRELIERLKYGLQTPVNITWTNTCRTREELAGKISKRLMLDSVTLLNRLEDELFLDKYGFDKETSRCLFIPNTYEVYWTITVEQLFDRMKREYDAFWTDERRAKADKLGLTPVEVSILASIVESETYRKSDMPLVASLYLNRLRKGMLLQACPTVKYAIGDFTIKRVLYRHLQIDSPYNTYKNKGLPPGPIRCPAATTLDFVLNAPKTDYIYMCANPKLDGTHIFSSNYNVHTNAAHQYHDMMNEKHIK